jgi:2Fe-2S ferredoxin
MVKITFRSAEGDLQQVEATIGESLMSAAKNADIAGVVAECGGCQVCGTCLVYIDEPWFSAISPPDSMEVEMVEYSLYPQTNGRLSCQVSVTESMDGMTVETPISQR